MGFPSKVNKFSIEVTVLGDTELTLDVTMVSLDSQQTEQYIIRKY